MGDIGYLQPKKSIGKSLKNVTVIYKGGTVMANWDLILEILSDADNGKLSEKANNVLYDSYIYNYETDDKILVVSCTDAFDYLENILKERMEISEEDKPITEYHGWYTDYATDNNKAFNDEGFYCPNCDKWHKYDTYSGNNYHIFAGEILCDDCIRGNEDFAEDYINDIKVTYDNQDTSDCNTILSEDQLIEMGWERKNAYPYENGMYGTNDSPKRIAEELWNKFGNETEILFDYVKDYNPFATRFNVWIRRQNNGTI